MTVDLFIGRIGYSYSYCNFLEIFTIYNTIRDWSLITKGGEAFKKRGGGGGLQIQNFFYFPPETVKPFNLPF